MESDGPGPADPSSLPLQPDLPTLKPCTATESPTRVAVNGCNPSRQCQPAGGHSPTCGPRKSPELPTTKLCGYLDKQGGPLKSWKSRWFCYDEKQCQLLYYTTAQDVTPLGKIELANAVFGYPAHAEEAAFHIQTPERTVVLKAFNRDAMIYWLQQLQLRRWHHGHASAQAGGDANVGGGQEYWNGDDDFLPIVKTPPGLVGQKAACFPAPRQQSNLSIISFKHPLTQIQNSVHCILQKRHSQEMNKSIFYSPSDFTSPVQENQDLSGQDEHPAESPSHSSPSSSPAPSPPSRKKSISDALPEDKEAHSQEVDSDKEEHPKKPPEDGQCTAVSAPSGKQEQPDMPYPLKCDGPEMGSQLLDMRDELAVLQLRLAQRDAHVAELQEHLQLMVEKNQAKQEVVLKLSEQVAECMVDPQRTITNSFGAQGFLQLQAEMEHLRDDKEAYKMQNKFLNSEIHQLTKLWRNSSEQQKILMKRCAYLEGKSCQTESRYLSLLHKLQENKEFGAAEMEAVNRLIKEAERDMKDTPKFPPVRKYDEYGFKLTPDLDTEDMNLMIKIHSPDICSLNPLQQEVMDKHRLSRWAQFLGGRPAGELGASLELKILLRGGIPSRYRADVWRWIVWTRTRQIRERHPQRYKELCRKSQTLQHPASRQIQLDLPRTLTSNQHFSSASSSSVQQLHRILLAFSWHNPSIGYCQGLNRLAAIALLVLKDEENAFWCLVAMVENIMPQDYYSKTLIASQADQRVLKDIMMEKLPRLMAHLEEHSVDLTCITFNWFLVVFVESLTSKILLRIWDAVLYESIKVIFRYALAIFRYKEEEILRIRNSAEIYQYLQFFTKTISDGRKLNNIAFVEMNPFPMKLLRNRRAHHLERLKAELKELERIQNEFLTESMEHKDRDLDPAVGEGEDEDDL
uniref:TBC1 domain family member 2 n=1 Tax=Paramormyrops kingsleyae TaxID=1676925 RepID=A0A3B3SVG1_9TELE|nr:TBC1 domain family member 2A-like [Paramormyrops kingsleyae]XP_023668249.1 TBC1 domain family member 2A-like [Paramormyrops kingsleyae]